MTDDSHPAQRGGGPLREDADATAQVVRHAGAADAPEAAVPGPPPAAEVPAQRSGPAQRPDPVPTRRPGPPPTYPQGTYPYGSPVTTEASGPASPAPANGVTSGTPPMSAEASGGYGPFNKDADPTSSTSATGASPWHANPTSAIPPSASRAAADPASAATNDPGPIYEALTPVAGPPDGNYTPTPTPETGPIYTMPPSSGAGQPYSTPTSGAGQPYGTPTSSPPSWSATDPTSAGALTPDPYGFSVAPAYNSGPRIEPTPKQPKTRFLLPALAGLLTGLLLFGTGGWFIGRASGDKPPNPTPTTQPVTTAPAAGNPYEQNQIAINQPKFTGPLAPVAQGWLTQLSGCTRSGEKGGPALNKGEKTRVRCEMDAMSVIFVEYVTAADRDKATVKTLGQNVDARTLTPGAAAAVTQRATPSGRTNGNYVEYAYKTSGRTVSGIWWDDSTAPVAAYLLAYWKEGTGRKWEPMRDVWTRYA